MRLSDLPTGTTATITKVSGHGGFRKRILEMGFVAGKTVIVMHAAPLADPVRYRIMGYEVTLRRSEAALIEVKAQRKERKEGEEVKEEREKINEAQREELKEEGGKRKEEREKLKEGDASDANAPILPFFHSSILQCSIALVGNPNSGKTSLFNSASGAHEHVGNYAGVTVGTKTGHLTLDGTHITITDLPGTYSLSPYSPEERYVRRHLTTQNPDVVINVIDATNLERSLYLTTQLIELRLPTVIALNMSDEAQRRGDHLDRQRLSELLGLPIVPTVFRTGGGVTELLRTAIATRSSILPSSNPPHDPAGQIRAIASRIKQDTGTDDETATMDAKYAYIHGALAEAAYTTGNPEQAYRITHRIDALLTHRWLGLPIFALLMALTFTLTFTLGAYPQDLIDTAVTALADTLSRYLPQGPVADLITDGAIAGVGAVIVFLPQLLILYLLLSIMEDTGYMARAAFITDRLMHKLGLHGKSFIPLVMAFGCNVPAIMATRTIESPRSRLATILITPLMSCSARLPIYVMVTAATLPRHLQAPAMLALYLLGLALAIPVSRLLTRHAIKAPDTPFVMELPPYRMPTAKAIARHTWEKGRQYLKKMGGIILVASIIVWAMGYFPHHPELTEQQQQEQSIIGHIGHAIQPAFAPQGFDWKLDVALLTGLGAKEIVASTIGVLYQGTIDQVTPLTAIAFLTFVLLYFPCIATIAAIKAETGSWRWAAIAALYTTTLAWLVSALVTLTGHLVGL